MLNEIEINKEVAGIEKFVVELAERIYEHIKEGYRPRTSDVTQLHEYTLQLDAFDWVLHGDEIMQNIQLTRQN